MTPEMKILETWALDETITLARVERYPDAIYHALFNEHMVPDHPILPWRSSLSGEAKKKFEALNSRLKGKYELRLALVREGKLIGWSYGWQDSVQTGDFYMAGSLVLPEFRGRGLYTAMVRKVLELCSQDGFSAIRSRHVCTNNAVIVAKLKLGFLINGFEQDETMGTLVRMIYHHNDLRRRSAHFRAGKIGDAGILESLSLAKSF